MITNLFSVFDPSSSLISFSLNWISTFLGLLFIPFTYWVIPSRWALLWNKVIEAIHREFKALLSPGQVKVTLLFTSLFSFILFNNFLGLMPYIFTSTSHLSMTLSLSLPFWISFILFGWINHTQHIFAHLVPQGTPGLLIPFMVLIETIRNVIRPGTLAVRLTANIIAGHLLLTLLEFCKNRAIIKGMRGSLNKKNIKTHVIKFPRTSLETIWPQRESEEYYEFISWFLIWVSSF